MARRKTDAERGPLGAWAYNTRDALELAAEAVMPMLPTRYNPATLRKVEGGSAKPGRRMWRELANLYGRLADEKHVPIDQQPPLNPEEETAAPAADMGDLVRAINDLVAEMRLARERDQDAAAAMLRAAEVLVSAQRPATDEASTVPGVPLGSAR